MSVEPISPIFVSALLSRSLETATGRLVFCDSRRRRRSDAAPVTHPGFVERVVLQAKQAAALAALHRGGGGQQARRLGDLGRVWGGGQGCAQCEALQLPLLLLLQKLTHHHLLLLGGRRQQTHSETEFSSYGTQECARNIYYAGFLLPETPFQM